MARPRREQCDPRVIKDWILKEGRGQGENGRYRSWLQTYDVASTGNRDRLPSHVTHITGERIVHLLSGLETEWFNILLWIPFVTDIREQYPLLEFDSIAQHSTVEEILASTMKIADELGIEHHSDPKSGLPIVPSSDFLVTLAIDGKKLNCAFEVKPSNKLGSLRTQQKLELSRIWHERHGHKWFLVTEKDIPRFLAANLEFLVGRADLSRRGNLSETDLTRIERTVLPALVVKQGLAEVTKECDAKLGLEDGTSLTVAYHCIYTRRWEVELDYLSSQRLNPSLPVQLAARHYSGSYGN